MILTKENVAAQAFADHIISLQLPTAVTGRIGRFAEYMELQKGKTSKTPLDVTPENRNDVRSGKRLLVGCGRGYQHVPRHIQPSGLLDQRG